MATTVQIDEIGSVEFPDTMSDADITSAIQANLPKWQNSFREPGIQQQGVIPHVAGRIAEGLVGAIAGPLESIGVAATGLARKFGDPILPQESATKLEERPTYQLGKFLRRKTAEVLPVDETRPSTFLTDTLPSAFGSMLGFVAGGVAGKVAKASGAATVAALGAGAGGADAFEEAKKKGASDEDAFKVFGINAGLGTTEAVPIGGWLARLNKASGNKLTRAIREGSEEAIQEIFQQYGSNLTAQKYYDPERPWYQGVIEGGGAGFTLGSLMSLVVSGIGGRRARLRKEEQYAIDQGQKQEDRFSEHPGISPQIQAVGEDRNVPPAEPQGGGASGYQNISGQGGPVAPVVQAPAVAPNLTSVFSAKGATDVLYQKIFAAIKTGASTVSGVTDPLIQEAKPLVDAGIIQSPEALKDWVEGGKPPLTNVSPTVAPGVAPTLKPGEMIVYQAGTTTTRGGVQYVADDPSVAALFASGGEFGRPGAVVKPYVANLNIFELGKTTSGEAVSLIGKTALRYVEPDGNINFHAFESEPEIAQRLRVAGYNAIRISEGNGRTSIAVLDPSALRAIDESSPVNSREEKVREKEVLPDAEKEKREVQVIQPPAGQAMAPQGVSVESLKGKITAITEQFNRPRTTKAQKTQLIQDAEEVRREILQQGGTQQDIQEATYGKDISVVEPPPGKVEVTPAPPAVEAVPPQAAFAEKSIPMLEDRIQNLHRLLIDSDAFASSEFYDRSYPIPRQGGIVTAKQSAKYQSEPVYASKVDAAVKDITDTMVRANRQRLALMDKPDTGSFGVDYAVEKVRATYGVNVVRAWHNEAIQKYPYTSRLGNVSVREGFQNSLDAVMAALQNKQIKHGDISVDVVTHQNKGFTIEDNGIGMSDADIGAKFLSLHSTGKAVEGRFGGFGIAKAVILGPADTATWTLRTRDNYFNNELAQANEFVQSVPFKQGTTIEVKTDKYIIDDDAQRYIESTELPKNVSVHFNGDPVVNPFKGKRPQVEHVVVNDKTEYDISYYPKAPEGGYNQKYIIRLVDEKTGARLTQAIKDVGNDGFSGTIVIDINTKALPGTVDYPLVDSRMELKWGAEKPVQQLIQKHSVDPLSALRGKVQFTMQQTSSRPEWRATIEKIAKGEDADYATLSKTIRDIWEKTGAYFGHSPEGSFTPLNELNIKIDTGFSGYRGGTMFNAKHLASYEAVSRLMAKDAGASVSRFYGMLSKPVNGVMVNAEHTSDGGMGLNYLNIDKTALKSPVSYALYLRDLIAHELTHHFYGPHNEEFTSKEIEIQRSTAHLFEDIVRIAEATLGREWKTVTKTVEVPVETTTIVEKLLSPQQLKFIYDNAETQASGSAKDELYYPRQGDARQLELGTVGGSERTAGFGGSPENIGDRGGIEQPSPPSSVSLKSRSVGISPELQRAVVDSQPIIDQALAAGGGIDALRAVIPEVRIRYGPLSEGVPMDYENGVITINKALIDMIAARWPNQTPKYLTSLTGHELIHAIGDRVIPPEDYVAIAQEMSKLDRNKLLADRPDVAAVLNTQQRLYQIGAEHFARTLEKLLTGTMSDEEAKKLTDKKSPLGQRIMAVLQKIWDYLIGLANRMRPTPVLDSAIKNVKQAMDDLKAGRPIKPLDLGATDDMGPLNAKAIKQAVALHEEQPGPESERALRMAQAGEVVLARPGAMEALEKLRSQAGVSKEQIAASPEQANELRFKRDVAQRVLRTQFVRQNLAMPSEHYQAAINALNGDLETFDRIRQDPNATPKEVGTAAANAFETLQMFEATKTSLLNAIEKRRPVAIRELNRTFNAETEAIENRDVYQVLTKDFKDMGRLLMKMQKDEAVLSAYKQATNNTAATRNVLKFIHDNMDFSGMTNDDLRSIDDLMNRVRSTIVENSGRFPKWNGSNVPEVVGANEDVIRSVLRIIALSEPFRTELENAKTVVEAKQYAAPLDRVKSQFAEKLKAGQYEGALELFTKGIVSTGINLKQSRDAAAFYLKNIKRLLVNIQAMDTVKEIAERLGSDPELMRQANEIYRFHNIATITHGTPTEGINKGKATAITFKRADPADTPITIEFGNTIARQEKNMEDAQTLASEYQAYIANPEAPGYDPMLAAGMGKSLDLLGRFLDPARNPKIRGRLVPSLAVRAWDFFSSKLGHFATIPKYITTGTTGHLADVVDLTRTALSTIGEKGGVILRQHESLLNNALKTALVAHGDMNEGEYHLMVLNPLASSRQNFNNFGMLKPGDAIGNGEVVTAADMTYLRAVREFENDLFRMIESRGHEFASVKAMFAGILFDQNGKVRSPITHGPDMTGRDIPPEVQTWVEEWNKATTPEAKIAFLDHWKEPLILGFVRGSRNVDWGFAYSYPLDIRDIARELKDKSAEPLVNFDDLITRIFDRQIVEEGVEPKDMDEIASDVLADFDRIFTRLVAVVAKGAQHPKSDLEIIGGDNSFNTPRSATVMPPDWYNYGVVTAGERAGTLRAASLSFQLAHIKAVEALRDSLARVVSDFGSKQTRTGVSERQLRRQSGKEMAAGDILYDYGTADRLLQNIDNWLTQLRTITSKSANPYVKDSVHLAAMRGGAQFVITSLVSGPAAVTKNVAGGYQNLAMMDMLLRRKNFVTALSSRAGSLVGQTLKELTYLATHTGNPATAGLRKLLEKSENVAFIGDVAKIILGHANQQRDLYNYATEAGVNYNVDLWNNIKSRWKFPDTLGYPRANDPIWYQAWANRASLLGNTLAQALGQATVGYADVRLNSQMLLAALQLEEHYRQIAQTWGDKTEASGLFPDKALGQGWWGNDMSAARIRDFFRGSGVGPIDAIMADFYKRWTADKAKEQAEGLPPSSLSSKTPFFTDAQMHQLEQALTEDNNAAYANRPTFFRQSQAHSKFSPLWGYPTWFINKLLQLTNGLSNKSWFKNLVDNMPMLIQIAIGLAAISTLGYGAAAFLKRFFENKVTGFPTVFDAQNPKQAAQAILAATADSVPFIGSALNSVTGAGYRTGFDVNSQFLALNFARDAMNTYKEVAQSGDMAGPLQRFGGRYFFPLNIVGAHAANVSGIREFTNAKNILSMGARSTGLETKLRRTGGGGSDVNYSPSTPIINEAMNAIGKGDVAGFNAAYQKLVNQKKEAGSLNPASAALTALRGRSPIVSVFGTKPTQQELEQVYANVSPALAERARSAINRFDTAIASLPRSVSATKTKTRASRTRSTGRRFGTLRRSRLRMPTLRLKRPRLRRTLV